MDWTWLGSKAAYWGQFVPLAGLFLGFVGLSRYRTQQKHQLRLQFAKDLAHPIWELRALLKDWQRPFGEAIKGRWEQHAARFPELRGRLEKARSEAALLAPPRVVAAIDEAANSVERIAEQHRRNEVFKTEGDLVTPDTAKLGEALELLRVASVDLRANAIRSLDMMEDELRIFVMGRWRAALWTIRYRWHMAWGQRRIIAAMKPDPVQLKAVPDQAKTGS